MSRIIIDTRSPEEYAGHHVEGAINIPPEEFMTGLPAALADIARSTEIIVYCRSGARSNTVSHILRAQGFTNIINGINAGHVEQLLSR